MLRNPAKSPIHPQPPSHADHLDLSPCTSSPATPATAPKAYRSCLFLLVLACSCLFLLVLACSWNIVVLSIAIEALVRCPAKVSRTLIGVAGPSRSPRIASSAFQPSCLRVLVRMGVDRACQALYGLTVPAWSTFPVVPV